MNLFDPALYANVRKPLLEAETMPWWCYASPEFYQREVETIFMKEWNFVGRLDYVPNPGDFFTIDFAGVPVVVARGRDNEVRAFINSCRHRGSKIKEGEGNCRVLQCPYHGWAFGLDGALLAAPGMKATVGFDRGDYPLIPVKLETWGGFLFINFDPQSRPLKAFLGNLPATFDCYAMEDMVLTRKTSYQVACNWKIYVENAMEAFHVPHVHKASINKQVGSVKKDRTFDSTEGNWVVMHKEHEGSRAVLPGDKGFDRIPTLKAKAARGTYYPLIFPSTMLGCTIDAMWFLEIHPQGPTSMELIVGACFPKATVARPDFAEISQNYYKRWDMTSKEDIEISVLQQKGTASPLSKPGRLSEHEPLIHAIDNWVLDHVLGVERATPRYQGFALQDLDVQPEEQLQVAE